MRVAATVDWWPLTFRVTAEREEIVRWFRHHLSSVSAGDEADEAGEAAADRAGGAGREVSISAVVDAELAGSAYRSLLAGPVERVEGYRGEVWLAGDLDGRQVRCREPGPDGRGGAVVLSASGVEHRVVGDDPSTVAADCVRLARELLRMELAERGSLTVHASMALRRGGGGLLFVGDTGAGKTTLSLAAAREGGYLVSIDQTEVLRGPGGGTVGVGFPWPARLGTGMLAGMGLDRAVEAMPLLRAQPAIGLGRITAESRAFRSTSKVELTALELDTVLGVLALDRAPVDAIVVIATTAPGEPLRCARTDLAEAAEELRREFREPDPTFVNFWMAPLGRSAPGPGSFADLLAMFAGLPVVRLAWRADTHPAPDALRAVYAAIESRDLVASSQAAPASPAR